MKPKHNESVPVTTTAPVVMPPPCPVSPHIPEFLRLPRPGNRCPFTGLTRSYMNLLVLPTEANGHKPPVRSYVLRRKGAKTGVRLVSYEALRNFILAHAEVGTAENNVQGTTV